MYRSFYFLIAFCWYSAGLAQGLRYFTTADGLPENTGQALVQDRQGYIWIGTQNGLSRFDGKDFFHIKAEDSAFSLSNNQIEALALYRDSLLLISTRDGFNELNLFTYQIRSFSFKGQESDPRNWFSKISFDDSTIYLQTFYGLVELNPRDLSLREFHPSPFKDQRVSSALFFDGNELWASFESRLYKLKDKQFSLQIALDHKIHDIRIEGNKVVLATPQGLLLYRITSEGLKADEHIFKKNYCLSSFRDSQDNLYALGLKGLFRMSPDGKVKHYYSEALAEHRISHDLCLSILEDQQGLIWLGTGQGLNLIDPRFAQFEILNEDFLGPSFSALQNVEVMQWQEGKGLWLGKAPGLALLFRKDGKWSLKEFQDPLVAQANIDYLLNKGDSLLIGTSDGEFLLFHKGEFKVLFNGEGQAQLRGIIPNGNRAYWLGFSSGFYLWENGKLYSQSWLPAIAVIQMDRLDQEIWVSSPEALYRIEPRRKSYRSYTALGEGGIFPVLCSPITLRLRLLIG